MRPQQIKSIRVHNYIYSQKINFNNDTIGNKYMHIFLFLGMIFLKLIRPARYIKTMAKKLNGKFTDCVIEDKSGLITKKPDVESIKDSINLYFKENLKCKFINNIKILKEKKSWTNFSEQIIRLYESL